MKLRDRTRTDLEKLLRDYPDYSYHIKARKESLLFPDSIHEDENIGGGRGSSISDPTHRMASTLVQDKVLKRLTEEQQAVEKILDESSTRTRGIIKEYYFKKPRTKTWDGIARDMSYSKRTCLRMRDEFFKRLAEELGMMI